MSPRTPSSLVRPCPARPNCVCSRDDAPARNRVQPLAVAGDPWDAFAAFQDLVAALPRTRVISRTRDRLHAVCRSRLGFADDLEARLDPEAEIVHVRSASRLGWHDFGVNRKRVETLRRRLAEFLGSRPGTGAVEGRAAAASEGQARGGAQPSPAELPPQSHSRPPFFHS